MSDVPDGTSPPQIVIEGAIQGLVEAEEDMDPRTLNIAVDDTDPVAQSSQIRGDVRRRVALTGPASKRVNRDHSCHVRNVHPIHPGSSGPRGDDDRDRGSYQAMKATNWDRVSFASPRETQGVLPPDRPRRRLAGCNPKRSTGSGLAAPVDRLAYSLRP